MSKLHVARMGQKRKAKRTRRLGKEVAIKINIKETTDRDGQIF